MNAIGPVDATDPSPRADCSLAVLGNMTGASQFAMLDLSVLRWAFE